MVLKSELTNEQASECPLYLQENMGDDGIHVKQGVRGEFPEQYAASRKGLQNTLLKYLLTPQFA